LLDFRKWNDECKKKKGEWLLVSENVIYGIDKGITEWVNGKKRWIIIESIMPE
jgi:hypothetical protein